MNYYASGKYLVVAESFKAAIGLYRQVIGDDPEAMQATAGFGEGMDVPPQIVANHADWLHEMADNVDDYSIGEYLGYLKSLAAEVTVLLTDEPSEPGVYEKVADKWQRVMQPVDSLVSPLADSDGWIKWNGGECPVADGSLVKVKFRGGEVYRDCYPEGWSWEHYNNDSDIVAYRVVS